MIINLRNKLSINLFFQFNLELDVEQGLETRTEKCALMVA